MDVAILVAPCFAGPITALRRIAVVVVSIVAIMVDDCGADDGAEDDATEDAEPNPAAAPAGVGGSRRGQGGRGDGRGGHKREDGLLHRVFPPGSGSAGADRLATILKPVPAPVKEAGLIICRKFDGLGSRPLSKS